MYNHVHNFWVPELPLSTLNLPLQNGYTTLLLEKIDGAHFSTFPKLKLLKVINSTSCKTLFSM